jgi:hypothetical protein
MAGAQLDRADRVQHPRTLQAILNEATHQVVLSNADPMTALRAAEARFTEAQ